MTPPELRDLLADGLALWDVAARPRVAGAGVAVTAPDGTALTIVPAAAEDLPVRWWVERPGQRRPCTSVLGLLRTLRNAVGAGEGETRRLRVARPDPMIPISVVTGFLGAGKSTLLRRVLRDPAWADSAVIVNEFGEVPLDQDLIAASEESFVSASTGCLCCVVRDDLTRTLLDLLRQREVGDVPRYARVLIETSGLADPAPILHALMADAALAATHALHSVVTLVDALHGAATLARHPEAQRQVMLADRILVTKPDLAAPPQDAIRALNPAAPLREAVHGAADPEWLFAPAPRPAELPDWAARHTAGVGSVVIEREAPIPALALTLWLQGLVEHAGPRLLRLKGLVALIEQPGRPAVLHAIQHMVHPLEWLDAWPGRDRTSRIVLIGERIPRYFPARLLAAIEAEVLDATTRRQRGDGPRPD